MIPLGQQLQTLRKARGLSLSETARSVGVSKAHLCDIEKSRRHPSNEVLHRLAPILSFRVMFESCVTYEPAIIAAHTVPFDKHRHRWPASAT